MGEIADAIRQAWSPHERGAIPGLVGRAAAAPRPPSGRVPTRDGHRVETVDPASSAIVLAENANTQLLRQIALRVRSELDARGARSVAVVSAVQGEGKTTVLCDLALALASLSRSHDVAVLDLDLRRPSVARYLSLPRDAGVEQVLLGEASLDDVRVEVHRPSFDVYPAVTPQRAAHELLVRPHFAEIIAELERRYATVLVDTPPTLVVPDTHLVLRHVAACVPVVRAGQTRARRFRQLMDQLPRRKMLGSILNGARATHAPGYDDYYGEDVADDATVPRKRSAAR